MYFWRELLKCFCGKTKDTSLEGGDVILAHAGGETIDGKPGKINEYLESVVRDIHKKTKLPIVAQGELARCLPDLPLVGNIPRQKESSTYIDTIYVCRKHIEICERNGWRHPILISYKPHTVRAQRVYKKMGMEVLIVRTTSVYDKKCSQWWMRSPFFNIPREIMVSLLWLFQGKI